LRRPVHERAGNEPPATLVCLDPETGHARGEAALRLPRQGESLLGPLVSSGERLWVVASGGNPAVREIVELRPVAAKTE
jgi:hypothetical protein